jgi:hypothetical protein
LIDDAFEREYENPMWPLLVSNEWQLKDPGHFPFMNPKPKSATPICTQENFVTWCGRNQCWGSSHIFVRFDRFQFSHGFVRTGLVLPFFFHWEPEYQFLNFF